MDTRGRSREKVTRRDFIAASALGAIGAAVPGETRAADPSPAPNTAGGAALGKGKIGDMEIGRLILGTNIITCHMHQRDLWYLKDLSRQYNTDAKILETFAVAEANGVNAFMTHDEPRVLGLLKEHRDKHGGKMRHFVAPEPKAKEAADFMEVVQRLVDGGASGIYVHGAAVDPLVANGNVKRVGEFVDIIRATGLPAGMACHNLDSLKACLAAKIECDFYLKTFHHLKYPSCPTPEELAADKSDFYRTHRCQERPHGIWCINPEETAACMANIKQPWIAYKVMAAGAILPKDAFKFAFDNGADFILAGMFDFQVAEDARLASAAHLAARDRARPWCA
ncbi:MAG TPA: twin-arginine translocation signal domain-containing protein [Verrucomicrobiae bacterium]|nr:twin-arginine translocation signal domain-containing protein [Verrucomicrobiae bacterium]